MKFRTAIVASVASVALLAPEAASAANTGDANNHRPWCGRLAAQPAYSYSYQGATISVPSGRVLLGELKADHVVGKPRDRACRTLVLEYRSHVR